MSVYYILKISQILIHQTMDSFYSALKLIMLFIQLTNYYFDISGLNYLLDQRVQCYFQNYRIVFKNQ